MWEMVYEVFCVMFAASSLTYIINKGLKRKALWDALNTNVLERLRQ
jgi:hypothetical protein